MGFEREVEGFTQGIGPKNVDLNDADQKWTSMMPTKAQLRFGQHRKSKTGLPLDLGRNRSKTLELARTMTVRTLPRTPRGEGSQEQNQKRH
jgi:hypothetical protein